MSHTRLPHNRLPHSRLSHTHLSVLHPSFSLSKKEAESRARAIEDEKILRIGETSTTPLFVFIVDEDLPDHESLPMSLHSADGSVDCGVMRQRSLADILWILFLTRISREVMALSLNTSLKPKDFTEYVIPFITQVIMDEFFRNNVKIKLPNIFQAIISLVEAEGLDNLNEHPSIGIELLVSSYLHLKDKTAILSLSRLLMLCKSKPNGETRLNDLINDASPTNELELLTRWFALLSSNVKASNFEVAIKSGGFTTATIRSNLLNAFYQIIEPEHEDKRPLVSQLFSSIRHILDAGTHPFFFEGDRQTLQGLQELAEKRLQKINDDQDPRSTILNTVFRLIQILLRNILSAPNRALKSGNSPPPK
ncbi:hypothetical protein BLNAU_21197 [Blattamonas nauphoetae]|uniref:Uncharacterized protein n=1 Tax=Blattamonas nauphoetae TaxID=2049346 RepID=A0ABQ9WWM3_9EUKA|nr:hypothetical protein BLNAU_21197 [Blattamonas nauphoetae]